MGSWSWVVIVIAATPIAMVCLLLKNPGMITSLFILMFTSSAYSSCKWKSPGGKRVDVKEGEVTRVRATTLEICMNGAIRLKKKADVGPNYKLACGGCKWKGKVICAGEVIQDLYTWWFETQCNGGRLRGIGRSWLEVTS